MAYNTKKLLQNALNAIGDHKLFFIEDVVVMIGISKPTFYQHFPTESNAYIAISEALAKNRMDIKVGIRAKLYKNGRGNELLALYRLVCDADERKMLNQQYIDHTSNGNELRITRRVVGKNDSGR